jgi:hypothetical protein
VINRIEQEMENRAEDDDESMINNQDKEISGDQLTTDHKSINYSM